MSESGSHGFYAELTRYRTPVSALFDDEHLFAQVPADWYVVLTDIRNSTQAVRNGLHQDVNLIATGSIIAVLNIARAFRTAVPFFFGGDGGTLLVPPSMLDQTLAALIEHRENTLRNFNLDLRVGHISVSDIYQAEHELRIARAYIGKDFDIPVVIGDGLIYAERRIKGASITPDLPDTQEAHLNLEGMECRWDKIKPPEERQEVVCLLVTALDNNRQASIYKRVLEQIDEIYGPQEHRNPITVPGLHLKATPGKINTEMRVKFGRFKFFYLIKNWFLTLFGLIYFRFNKQGQYYLTRLVELSDILVLDGRINTIISGTARQRLQLTEALNRIEQEGDIIYGLHVSQESVMSCYVMDRQDHHIHFVDGSEGGYTKAAGMLKMKLRNAP